MLKTIFTLALGILLGGILLSPSQVIADQIKTVLVSNFPEIDDLISRKIPLDDDMSRV